MVKRITKKEIIKTETRTRARRLDVLKKFLGLSHAAYAVHDVFSRLPGAIRQTGEDGIGFVYVPSRRPSPVLMVAHADVIGGDECQVRLSEDDWTIRNPGRVLGADDRAGCAIIWALRDIGHGILITDGEECGCLGAEDIMVRQPEFHDELQHHYQFMVEFDRKGGGEYKCYNVGTEAFRGYIEAMTGFHEPDRRSRTDITILARDICGVNLSCGYMKQHTNNEYIVKRDWLDTLHVDEKWLSAKDLPRFEQKAL